MIFKRGWNWVMSFLGPQLGLGFTVKSGKTRTYFPFRGE